MGAFEYRQAEEIRDVFQSHGVRYLFIGKSGAILLGFPDTTQDADLFVDRSPENCRAIVAALAKSALLTDEQIAEIDAARILSSSRMARSTSTWFSRPTASSV